ncbi:MAG: AAA family ATPase [Candidatus Thorarchaeota archaeon]|nr:MAG: hypothetical protein DRO87_08700 [Candidatus Thorarchaeota archaeon]RLI56764.1 MAG: hypothetical protein DRP09_05310 [Candidatus Thorarchaeota archaeon]
MEPLLWCIKYRPKTWDDFVGQDAAIEQLKNLAHSHTLTNMIFYGPTGTGKTAAAEIFAREVLGSDYSSNYKLLNVRDVWDVPATKAKRKMSDLAKLDRGARTDLDEYMSVVYREAKAAQKARGRRREPTRTQLVQESIKFFASTVSVSENPVKVLVLDEADALTHSMQQALRRTMEQYSDVCRFILITPSLSGWSPAILSRCHLIRFPNISEPDTENLIRKIAEREGVRATPEAVFAISRESLGDLRRAINLLQVSAVGSDIVDEDTIYENSELDLTTRTREAVSKSIAGDFVAARKELRQLLTLEGYTPEEVCLEIERDLLKRPFAPPLLNRMMTRVAEIDYRMTQSKNKFMQLTALLASIRAMAAEGTEQT